MLQIKFGYFGGAFKRDFYALSLFAAAPWRFNLKKRDFLSQKNSFFIPKKPFFQK